jgi:NAD(P)-dependent dehydrogenase (short-subunit alcohol dehydrogenase family)
MTIALVTGGGRGLGRSAALHLARAGVDVVLTWHRNEAAAQAVVAEIEALGRSAVALPLDTTDIAGFPAFVAALSAELGRIGDGRIDCLVNNAGTAYHAPFGEVTEAGFDAMLHVHLKGPYFLTQALLPLLRDGGRILNISTGLTRFTLTGYSAYGAMKGAVEVWTRYLARELGPRGISANVLAPGSAPAKAIPPAGRGSGSLTAMISTPFTATRSVFSNAERRRRTDGVVRLTCAACSRSLPRRSSTCPVG